jgi:glucosamine-6-phosphate deaminase
VIRRGEARAALQGCGLPPDRIRFLDLPFYERGRNRQFAPDAADVAAVSAELRTLRPHQIFATGQSEDPSSVAVLCFDLVRRALESTASEAWRQDCRVWLYHPANRGWAVADIDMAVPFSPRELTAKMQAIHHHKSQRSQSPLAGGRPRGLATNGDP